MNKRLFWAGSLTLVLFPLVGWLGLYFFTDESPWELMFRNSWNIPIQVPIGILAGAALGKLAQAIVSSPLLKKTEITYARMIGSLNLNETGIILLSLCAGIGEELLFRGAIQPYLGIWLTAFIFVAIHGYLNPMNLRLSVYGLFMTLAIACLGWMTEEIGIVSAILAHASIDYVLFKYLTKKAKQLQIPRNLTHETL